MKMLQKQSLKRVIIWAILLFIFGGFMLSLAFPSFLSALEPAVTLDEIDFSGDIEGIHVRDTVYGIYDYYCEETENNNVVAREYIIDANNYYFIGLRSEHRKMKKADNLLEATIQYLNGNDDGTMLVEAQYTVDGVIKAMPYDSKRYYHEYADWCDLDREIFLPYYIEDGSYGLYDKIDLILFGILGISTFGLGILLFIWALTGHYQRNIKTYINNCPNKELATAKVENFLSTVPLNNGMRYNHEFIFGINGVSTTFGETDKLVWAYKHIVTQKRNFITVGKSYSLMLGFADGTLQGADIATEELLDKHMENLHKLCPKAIFDYSSELEKMFNKNLPQFLNLKYNAPEQSAETIVENTDI